MTSQGADERRIRSLLVTMGVGPDAAPAPAPAPARQPTAKDDSWWDELYADEPAPPRRPSPRLPDWWRDKPEDLTEQTPDPAAAAAPVTPPVTPPTSTPPADTVPTAKPDTPPAQPPARPAARRHAPPQSLLDAWDSIRPRTRWLIHHATAAAAGWPIGLVGWGSNTAAWFAAGNWTAPSAWVCYGLGIGAITLHRRTRTWFWPVAWAATIPVSSITAGVLLYAPTP